MATTQPSFFGVFDNASSAESAIDALHSANFGDNQIYYSGRPSSGASGGFMSGLRNFFSGDDTTANTGAVSQDLSGLGIPDDEANYYDQQYQAGHSIVGVRTTGNEQDALSILQANGAQIYSTRASGAEGNYTTTGTTTDTTTQTDPNYATTGTNAGAYTTDTGTDAYNTGATATNANTYGTDATANTTDTDEQRRLRLREEQLNVSKERVQAGQVGLHKDVVEEQKNIDVPVTHEEVYVEQRPVTDGVVNEAPIGEGENINVPVSAEQVNVSKDTVTTGEVAIGKRQVEGTQRVSDTVRREEARVDQQGDVPVNDVTNNNVNNQ